MPHRQINWSVNLTTFVVIKSWTIRNRRATSGECVCVCWGGGLSPAFFLKIEKDDLILYKKCPDFGKMLPDCIPLWVRFSFKMQF